MGILRKPDESFLRKNVTGGRKARPSNYMGEKRAREVGNPECTAAVARQPIFDASLAVCGYELLYRSVGADSAQFSCPVAATASVIVTAALDVGLRQLAGNLPVFINFPRDLLKDGTVAPIDATRVVVEVLEDVRPDEDLIQSLLGLRARGYKIALDDFEPCVEREPLLACADFVKVDIQAGALERLMHIVACLRRWPCQLIAEKVETKEQFELCRSLGFDGFQGYFLQRPEMFYAKRPAGDWTAMLRLLLELNDPEASVECIESTIACDMGLCYRLLRCVNSGYYYLAQPIDSIGRAVVVLGLDELRAMCVVILLAGIDDRPRYLATQALIRARMCESLCVSAGLRDRKSYFMAGLLSLTDVLLGVPLEEVLHALPLGAAMLEALLRGEGPMGEALKCVRRYEEGAWEEIGFRDVPTGEVADAYSNAVHWAEQLWARLAAHV